MTKIYKITTIVTIVFSLFCTVLCNSSFTSDIASEEPPIETDSKIKYSNFFKEKKHWCNTMVITCSDFRYTEATHELINNRLGLIGDYDYFSIPGSIRNLLDSSTREIVLDTFGISVRLHHVKDIIIISHQDCMGYGGSGAFETKEEEKKKICKDLKKARWRMQMKFRKQVYLYYGSEQYEGDKKIYYFEQIL
ncbi:MAG: hypothetical protein MRJ65_00965 [Candidatus Brocadiaceae bacterium]|nr:hypothetical protein [Candidatus Brocadiaceae bacterium]